MRINPIGLFQQLAHLFSQLAFLVLHPAMAYRFVLGCIRFNLAAIESHPTQFHGAGLQCHLKDLLKERLQGFAVYLPEIRYSAEVRFVPGGKYPERHFVHPPF